MKYSRTILGVGTAIVAAGMMYGSWAPFQFRSATLDEVWTAYLDAANQGGTLRSDTAANVALGLPFALLMTSLLYSLDGGRWWFVRAVPITLAATLTLSLALELVQGWLVNRVPSLRDTEAQLIGAVAGCLIGWTAGPAMVRALDQLASAPRRSLRVHAMTTLAAMAALLWSVLPAQILVSPADYARKWTRGQIELIPFTRLESTSWELIGKWGWSVLVGLPLGLWAWSWLCAEHKKKPTLSAQVLLLLGLGLLPEALQLFVAERYCLATDAVFTTLGVVVGYALARFVWNSGAGDDGEEGSRLPCGAAGRSRSPEFWFALAVGFLLLLVLVSWFPFDFVTDTGEVKRRLKGIAAQPFADSRGSNFRLLFGTLRNAALGGMLGVLAGVGGGSVHGKGLRKFICGVLFPMAMVVALGVELGQLLESSHTAGVAGAVARLLGMWTGMAVGMAVVWRRG